MPLQRRGLLRERVTFMARIANLTHRTGELLFVPFGESTMFGCIGRDSLHVGNELLITLPGGLKCSFGTPLCITGLLGLQHGTLLDPFEPGRRPMDLCPQVLGVGPSQRFELTKMGRPHVAQRLFRLRADDFPLGGNSRRKSTRRFKERSPWACQQGIKSQ